MGWSPELTLVAFVAGASLVLLVALLLGGGNQRLERRLRSLSPEDGASGDRDALDQFTHTTLPRLGKPLLPKDEEERTRLASRLLHAGLYGRQAMVIFLGVKMLLMVGPPLAGLVAGLLGILPLLYGLLFGFLAGGLGALAPSFWLDYCKARRQTGLRRALPDALDILVICLEGGVSFPGALRRVSSELRLAHPLLATEMNIVQREVQLGRASGEALRQFGNRCDIEEVRSLASVVLQTERYGASLVKALKVHAETLRVKRMQRAEEMAQKAVIKILFPTLLCIFPAIFLVILGPTAIHLAALFQRLAQ